MLDMKFLRENPDVVKQNIKNKFQDSKLPLVDEVIDLDAKARKAKQDADALRSERNKYSKQIGGLMAQGKKEEAEEMKKKTTARYMDFFKIYYRHRDKISRITLWGLHDATSWLNDWPVRGRTNYPLLFDRDYQAKPVVEEIINLWK